MNTSHFTTMPTWFWQLLPILTQRCDLATFKLKLNDELFRQALPANLAKQIINTHDTDLIFEKVLAHFTHNDPNERLLNRQNITNIIQIFSRQIPKQFYMGNNYWQLIPRPTDKPWGEIVGFHYNIEYFYQDLLEKVCQSNQSAKSHQECSEYHQLDYLIKQIPKHEVDFQRYAEEMYDALEDLYRYLVENTPFPDIPTRFNPNS